MRNLDFCQMGQPHNTVHATLGILLMPRNPNVILMLCQTLIKGLLHAVCFPRTVSLIPPSGSCLCFTDGEAETREVRRLI